MDKFDFKYESSAEEKPKHNRSEHGPCEVYGCPRVGTIYTSGWNCRYHHGKNGHSLAYITMTLRNHAYEFDWYDRLLNLNAVDFAMNVMHKNAPSAMNVLPDETYKQYKTRMQKHVEELLQPKNRTEEIAP